MLQSYIFIANLAFPHPCHQPSFFKGLCGVLLITLLSIKTLHILNNPQALTSMSVLCLIGQGWLISFMSQINLVCQLHLLFLCVHNNFITFVFYYVEETLEERTQERSLLPPPCHNHYLYFRALLLDIVFRMLIFPKWLLRCTCCYLAF